MKGGDLSGYKRSEGINPHRAWLMIVVVFFLLNTGVALYAYWLFQTVVEGDLVSIDVVDDNGSKEINIEKLKETVRFYREKEKEYYRLGGIGLLQTEVPPKESSSREAEVSFKTR